MKCARGARIDCGGPRRVHCRAAVLPGFARHLDPRGCGQALGARHTARHRLWRAVSEGVGSRGRWSWMRWSSARCGRRVRCSSVAQCGGGACPRAAHPRAAGREEVAVFSTATNYWRLVFTLYWLHFYPEAKAPMPMLSSLTSAKFLFCHCTCNYVIERANQRRFAGTTHATPTLSLSRLRTSPAYARDSRTMVPTVSYLAKFHTQLSSP